MTSVSPWVEVEEEVEVPARGHAADIRGIDGDDSDDDEEEEAAAAVVRPRPRFSIKKSETAPEAREEGYEWVPFPPPPQGPDPGLAPAPPLVRRCRLRPSNSR
jgi:hypothetical protein